MCQCRNKEDSLCASDSLLVVLCCGHAIIHSDLFCSWKKNSGTSLGYAHNTVLSERMHRVERAGCCFSSFELLDEASFSCCFPTGLALFSLFGSFSSSSLTVLFVYPFFKVARSPPSVLIRTCLTCLSRERVASALALESSAYLGWGGCHWTHASPPDTMEDVLDTTTSIQNWEVALVGHHPLFSTSPFHHRARQVPSQ